MGIILQRWHTENDFLDANGAPKVLPFDGNDITFSELVKRFGGDIPPGAMRTELKRINAVREVKDGHLEVLKRNVSGKETPERLIDGLSWIVYPAILALANNTREDVGDETWVMRAVSTARVRQSDIPRLKKVSTQRLTEFSEAVDDMFAAYGTVHDDDPDETGDRSIGVGVFYFEEQKDGSTYFYQT